ncbi:MAG TPA: metal-dependent hydrolase [Gemmataceae bacterium]|nr:metal-dependent hydrolase [Gemmataceae bacterium]
MAPGTHALIGWCTANVVPLTRRDRLLVFLGGMLPDLDGLGVLLSSDAYFRYHHILCHNLLGCLVWALAPALFARDRLRCVTLTVLNWHLHLACDYFGSRGPWNTPPWVLPYFYPFIGGWSGGEFVGPAWYWNPWQWPLNSWANTLVTVAGIVGWVYIAVRLDRTWFEFVWRRLDVEVCQMLRKWFGGRAEEQWSEREGKVILRAYLAIVVLVLLACVLAGSHGGGRGGERFLLEPLLCLACQHPALNDNPSAQSKSA